MKNILITITTLFLFGCSSGRLKMKVKNGLKITNATIITFDSFGELSKYKGTIVIDSSKIIYAGNKTPVLNGNYSTIDASGKYVIPGLIDSHVHLANMAGMNFRHKRKYPELVKEYFEQLPKSFLYFGYTSLIDLNNYSPALINKIKSTSIRPDIYTCGEQIMVMNDFMMEMEEYPEDVRYKLPFLHDHYNKQVFIPDSIDLKNHTAKALVNNIVEEQNGICVKTLYEDASSGMNVTWEKPSKNLLKDIVQESKKEGVPSIIHASSLEGQTIAYEAGIDIIAHAMWNWSENPNDIIDTVFSDQQIQLLTNISKSQIGYQPTFRTITGEIDILNNSLINDDVLEKVYPENYLNWLKSEEGDWLKKRILNRPNYLKKTNPVYFQAIQSKFSTDSLMVKSIYAALTKRISSTTSFLAKNKANLLLGTDFGAMNMFSIPPGYSGFQEMQHWYESGVDLPTIFKASTINNAKEFNLSQTVGSIEKGKIANLVLLDDDPLKDINAYNTIDIIVLHGNPILRQELSTQ